MLPWISAYLILWLFTVIYRKHLGVVRDIYILRNYFLCVCVIIWRTAQWYGVWKQYYANRGSHKSSGFKQKGCGWEVIGVVVEWLFSSGVNTDHLV